MTQESLLITPKIKIFDLLETYPQLESVLLEMAPQFKKLKNPILRKTITKITNLNQAATIAGLNVEEMVKKLRKAIGQEYFNQNAETGTKYTMKQPVWFDEKAVVNNIDIRSMLHQGEQPVHEILSQVKLLKEGEILEVIAPFIPAPLIDKTLSLGYRHWLKKVSVEEFRVYLKK